MPTVTRTCHYCEKEYQTYDKIKLKYCSMECCGNDKKRGTMQTCIQCGKEYYQQRSKSDQKYCSISCGITARNLTDQNPSYHRDVSGENNPMYGKGGMKGEDNPMYGRTKDKAPRWNGGRQVRHDGYVIVVAPDNHPYPCDVKPSGTKYILEHRHVMEQHLGRYLAPGEVVHHIDGNPTNNDIANLQLFASQSDHVSIGHGSAA